MSDFPTASARSRSTATRPRVLPLLRDVVILVVLVLAVFADRAFLRSFGLHESFAVLFSAALSVPVVASIRAPFRAWQIMATTLLGLTFACGLDVGPGYNDAAWPWPVFGLFGFAFVLFSIGRNHDRSVLVTVGAVTVIGVIVPAHVFAQMSVKTCGILVVVVAACLAWGDSVGGRTAAQRALAAETDRREQERQRGAVLAERARIARELHDVVAHHISMIAIQAEAAPHRLDSLSDDTERTFGAIRSASREALGEMRRILGLLRNDTDESERTPQPRIGDVERLVESANQAGVTATLSIVGTTYDPPSDVGVSAYRVIQEALNNAVRHARGTRVEVIVEFQPQALRLSIKDDGASSHDIPDEAGNGLGIVNMRERVSAIGGTFAARPRSSGGFQVHAELPVYVEKGAE